jgi:SAM-dependent methyltransferase
MARRVRRAAGLDATWPMLAQARRLADKEEVRNVAWYDGDTYALPFGEGHFDIVTCRFALHHFEHPEAALREMMRVCKFAGAVLVCDTIASDDSSKAEALNAMERFRDPSTVEVRPLAALLGMFAGAGLAPPAGSSFRCLRNAKNSRSFPAKGDRDGLRRMIDDSVADDTMDVGARHSAGTVVFAFPSVILSAVKPRIA